MRPRSAPGSADDGPGSASLKVRSAGAPFQLYDLRREWFSSAADSGLTYDQAADLAGNSPVIAKRVYAKRAVESLKRDAAKVKPAGTGLKRQG